LNEKQLCFWKNGNMIASINTLPKEKIMVRLNFRSIFVLVLGLVASSGTLAQERITRTPVADKYLISARAGGVNFTQGTVSIIRAEGKSGILLKGDMVEIGDRVSTASDGKAEILLNPGSYIRLGGNSSFEFGATDLEDLQIKLDSGSAVFEVFAANEFRVSVSTPKGKVALIETGVYQIDIYSDGEGLISVTKGKAEVGEANATTVKGGRTATIGTDAVAIGKFDKDKRGELAEWSRSRAKELTQITSSLRDQTLNNSLSIGYSRGLWGMYDSFGLWIYSAQYGRYCFLPFGHSWYSPYGYGYNTWIYWNNPIYIAPVTRSKVSTRGPRVTGTEISGSPSAGKVSTRSPRSTSEPPPFTKVGRGHDGGFGSPVRNADYSGDKSSTRNSSPSYSPPSYSPPSYSPPPAPPAPTKTSTRDN
jgi:hypothetical protein